MPADQLTKKLSCTLAFFSYKPKALKYGECLAWQNESPEESQLPDLPCSPHWCWCALGMEGASGAPGPRTDRDESGQERDGEKGSLCNLLLTAQPWWAPGAVLRLCTSCEGFGHKPCGSGAVPVAGDQGEAGAFPPPARTPGSAPRSVCGPGAATPTRSCPQLVPCGKQAQGEPKTSLQRGPKLETTMLGTRVPGTPPAGDNARRCPEEAASRGAVSPVRMAPRGGRGLLVPAARRAAGAGSTPLLASQPRSAGCWSGAGQVGSASPAAQGARRGQDPPSPCRRRRRGGSLADEVLF